MRVEITSNNIQKLQLATKVDDESGELMVKVSVESKLSPADIARLLNLQKNKAPLFFSVGSQQAQLDLEFISIKSEKVEKAEEPPSLVECDICHGKGSSLDEKTRIDVACPICRGTGLVPVSTPVAPETETSSAESKAEKVSSESTDLAATGAAAKVDPESNGAKPKRRSRKPKQTELPIA